jgi:hypothetical protein
MMITYMLSIGQGKIFRIVPGAPQVAPPLSFPEGEQVPAAAEDEEIEANTRLSPNRRY